MPWWLQLIIKVKACHHSLQVLDIATKSISNSPSQSFANKILRIKFCGWPVDHENLKNYIPQKFVHLQYIHKNYIHR